MTLHVLLFHFHGLKNMALFHLYVCLWLILLKHHIQK